MVKTPGKSLICNSDVTNLDLDSLRDAPSLSPKLGRTPFPFLSIFIFSRLYHTHTHTHTPDWGPYKLPILLPPYVFVSTPTARVVLKLLNCYHQKLQTHEYITKRSL